MSGEPPRRVRPLLFACALLVSLLGASAANAWPPAIDWAGSSAAAAAANPGADLGSVSYSTWTLQAGRVTARFLLPAADAQRLAGSDIEVLVQQRVGDYLLDHLAVREGGAACEAIDQGYDIGRVDPLTVAAGLYGFEIFFQCAPPGIASAGGSAIAPGTDAGTATGAGALELTLEDHALFDRLAGQVDFARVQIGNAPFRMQLFTRSQQQLTLAVQRPPPAAAWHRYLALGFARLFGHWDRLCFLLGVSLLARSRRELPAVAAGLALGYALSVPAALAAHLIPRGGLLGAALGLLVALTAARLLVRELERPRIAVLVSLGALLVVGALALLAHATAPVLLLLAGAALLAAGVLGAPDSSGSSGPMSALLPALFGFLDGFVLPEALAPQQLTARALLPMVAGYDVGALVAALAVVSALMLSGAALAAWPAAQRVRAPRALATEGVTALLAGVGVFWMLSRLHS